MQIQFNQNKGNNNMDVLTKRVNDNDKTMARTIK